MEEYKYDLLIPPKKNIDFIIEELQFNNDETQVKTEIHVLKRREKELHKFPKNNTCLDFFTTSLKEQLPFSTVTENIDSYTSAENWGILNLKTIHLEIYVNEKDYITPYGTVGSRFEAEITAHCTPMVICSDKTFTLNLVANERITYSDAYNNQYTYFVNNIIETTYLVLNKLVDDLSSQLWPHWTNENRFYYAYGDKFMRKASRALSEDNWKYAIELWKEASLSKHPATKKHGIYNLIIGYEIINELDSAIITANNYYNLYKTDLNSYIQHLKERKQEVIRLNEFFK